MEQDGVPPRSRYAVYRLNRCSENPVEAFVAPDPVAFSGNELALQALAGTPLWGTRGAALLAADQTPSQFGGMPVGIAGEMFYDPPAFTRAAESTGRKAAQFRKDMTADARSARERHRAVTGFAIDRSAETRIAGDRNPLGMRATFVVSEPGLYHVYAHAVPRISGRGIIRHRELDGAALSAIPINIPLAQHPVVDIGLRGTSPSSVRITYVLRGPDGRVTTTSDARPSGGAIVDDAYASVQDALLAQRQAQLQRDATAVYSHPVSDAADYTLVRIEMQPVVHAAYASIAIPQTVLAAPVAEPLDTLPLKGGSAIVHLVPHRRTIVSYRVPVTQPAQATALAFEVAAKPLPAFTVSLDVRDAASGETATVRVPLDGLANCYACLVMALERPVATPLGVPLYDGHTPSPNVERFVLSLAHVIHALAPQIQRPRVTALVVQGIWDGGDKPQTLRATLENVAFRKWVYSPRVQTPRAAPVFIDGKSAGADVRLAAGRHRISTRPIGTGDVDSVLLVHGALPHRASSELRPISEGASEIVGSIDSAAGLLVFPQTYMYGWRLAIVPHDVAVSGNPYVDAWRLRRFMLPENAHRIVNGNLNGWIVPKLSGRIALIFMPTAVSAYGALATVVLICCTALAAMAWRRRA
jgi:hypothetical protein